MQLEAAGQARMRGMVDRYSTFVGRVLRKGGVATANLDDEVQRTFIVAATRLEELRLGAERSFLHQVALNVASHARRRSARSREDITEDPPEPDDEAPSAEQLVDDKRMQQLLDRVVHDLSEPLRTVFVLHVFQDKSLTEIAAALRIPRGTAASRLRRARRELRVLAAALRSNREGTA